MVSDVVFLDVLMRLARGAVVVEARKAEKFFRVALFRSLVVNLRTFTSWTFICNFLYFFRVRIVKFKDADETSFDVGSFRVRRVGSVDR